MIEKIKLGKGNCAPCKEVLNVIKNLKHEGKQLSVAEIGVDIGATACEILKLLCTGDKYYMFDFESTVNALKKDFDDMGGDIKAEVIPCGNSAKTFDSYNWTLQKIYIKEGRVPMFDVVYLDGAHTFLHDGLAVCLLRKMIKDEGFLILDDIKWSMAKSPTCSPSVNPSTATNYTEEQIECAQVSIVADIFLDNDSGWEKVDCNNDERRIYQRNR